MARCKGFFVIVAYVFAGYNVSPKMGICMTGLVSNKLFSSYPSELQGALRYIQTKAPDLLDRAHAEVGSIQMTLTLPSESVPTYRSWLSPLSPYVRKDDLKKLPIDLDGLGDEDYVYTSELAKRSIQISSRAGSAFWSLERKTIYFPVGSLKSVYEEVSILCFELGNVSESAFYQDLRLKNLTQCNFIQEVELKEREIHERTGKLLKKLDVPNQYNPYRFPFPEKAYLMAMEVFGHIEKTNRYYCYLKGSSLPPPRSLWEHPIEDPVELQGLIYQMGLVCFGDTHEQLAAQRILKRRESKMKGSLALNWNQFKSLCNK